MVFAIDLKDSGGYSEYKHIVTESMGDAVQWTEAWVRSFSKPVKEIKIRFQGEVANT